MKDAHKSGLAGISTSGALKNISGPIRLKNTSCIYCFQEFGKDIESDDEHVIGRNFVPSGSIKANDWNLIARACKTCNNEKSKLENEVSAVTLQPDIATPHTNVVLQDLSRRKGAKVKSGFSNRLVQDSIETASYAVPLGVGASITFGMVAPPQLKEQTMQQLAAFHIHAFFYLITFDEQLGRGKGLPGGIIWMQGTRKTDWGNRTFRAFADLTKDWVARVVGNAAGGYFRIAIKREPQMKTLWSFALEWNRCLRMIGFIGNRDEAIPIISALPGDELYFINATDRYREEVPLNEDEDVLFHGTPQASLK